MLSQKTLGINDVLLHLNETFTVTTSNLAEQLLLFTKR